MIVEDVTHYVDDKGNPIDEVIVTDSKYESIDLLEIIDERTVVISGRLESGKVESQSFHIGDHLYRGVIPKEGDSRQVNSDFRHVLNLIGFSAVFGEEADKKE